MGALLHMLPSQPGEPSAVAQHIQQCHTVAAKAGGKKDQSTQLNSI